MSPLDRHLTTEQLSAMLDHQLSPEDTEESYQAHLLTCEQCQQELAELRQTVQLLREMPPPPLPRSFTLPVMTTLEPADKEPAMLEDTSAAERPIPIGTRSQARSARLSARRGSVRAALRMVSGLVAVIGICFVLTGLFSALKIPGASTNSATSTNSASTKSQQADSNKSPVSSSAANPHAALTPAATQVPDHISPANNPVRPIQPASGASSTFLFIDINTTPGKFGLGILLAILGTMGFSLFKQRKKRYRP